MLGSTTTTATPSLLTYDFEGDRTHIALPRPELHLVARFGPTLPRTLDVHVLGARERVVRKRIHAGQRSVMARLPFGTAESLLGATASSLVGRIVPLEDLWGATTTARLTDRLAEARTTEEAAGLLGEAIEARGAPAPTANRNLRLCLEAARRLADANVRAVANDLGVSERHLRRIFHETVGLGPKAYAKLARFHRALGAASSARPASWAGIAAAAGYYDQAHLIAEFRAIAGVTPRELLGELRAAPAVV